jgi:hypothetical protein
MQNRIMALNPYATQLGANDPRQVIAQTPARLAAIVDRLGAAGLDRSWAQGKWSARAILCHLADCEIAFAFRLRQSLAEDNHVMQPFDQDAFARTYAAADAEAALAAFIALRNWNVALVSGLGPAELAKKCSHPERGEMTLETIVQTMGGHDLNHLHQLETAASATA